MIQRDYILRMLEELSKILAKILSLKASGNIHPFLKKEKIFFGSLIIWMKVL